MSVFVTYFLYDLREREDIAQHTSSPVYIYIYIPALGVVKLKRLRVASRRWQKKNPHVTNPSDRDPPKAPWQKRRNERRRKKKKKRKEVTWCKRRRPKGAPYKSTFSFPSSYIYRGHFQPGSWIATRNSIEFPPAGEARYINTLQVDSINVESLITLCRAPRLFKLPNNRTESQCMFSGFKGY